MGHELSVVLLVEVVEVVEIVVIWAVSLVLEARKGAEAEVIVVVLSVVTVCWLAVAVLVVVTGVVEAEAVNVRVDVLAGMDGVTIVVTTMRLTEFGEICDKVVTTVTAEVAAAEGTPIESLVNILWQS